MDFPITMFVWFILTDYGAYPTSLIQKEELLFIFRQLPVTIKLHFKIILFPDDMGEALYLLLYISPIAKV